MPKRGENIHRRKDGRWEGRYKSGINASGKTIYSSVYGRTYAEVKSKLISTERNSKSINVYTNKEHTFQEVLFLWQSANKIKHKGATEAKYEYLINKHIIPELGNLRVSRITTYVLTEYMNNKLEKGRLDNKGGLSPAYVRSIMIIITSAMQFAVDEHICQPLNTPIFKPVASKKKLSILSVSEQLRLESHLITSLDNTKIGILISLYTGLRIGEVCALMWDDIDFYNKIIHVRSTVTRIKNPDVSKRKSTILVIDCPKTKASLRDVPISSKLFPLLVKQKKLAVSKYVISDKRTFLSPRTYEYRYHKIMKEIALPDINYHALRHTFATRCIEVGVDVKTLSEILGHANVSITLNTYVHSSMELKRKQIEKLSYINL